MLPRVAMAILTGVLHILRATLHREPPQARLLVVIPSFYRAVGLKVTAWVLTFAQVMRRCTTGALWLSK